MIEDDSPIITALDLGSSLVKVVIGRLVGDHEIEIIGTGVYPSTGIKNGSIVNIETTTKSIIEAFGDAELMAGQEITSVVVNVSGKSVHGFNEKGIIAVTNRERIVTEMDIMRVVEAAQAVHVPNDQQVIHVLTKEFKVDDQVNIKDPIGMTGVRLEAEVHIVSCGNTALNNIDRCVEQSGLLQMDKVLSSLASSEAILTAGEKDLGTAVIDIGAGICDIIIYVDGGIAYSSVVPFGGFHITSDISIGLKTTVETAEIIKKRYGHTRIDMVDPTEKFEIPSISGRPARSVFRQELVEILEPRVREILEMIDHELIRSGYKSSLAGGVILTGGTSLLQGIEVTAEEVFRLSVGRAKPAGLGGLVERIASPEYATAVGLIKYSSKIQNLEQRNMHSVSDGEGWMKKVRRWMENNL
ncbi:cell division protein FtsA [Leptospira biflexa]|uniref:Cell division protein FtsA n=1 Tax=Leptospira biflexa serovar Patoc (strain Patoc 1 / ATCC 23582 / Paris) TaxID=456481 RepID=B0SJE0_LEPBP|nr:cell division protein FtsA [Leptospira biflexa]ABZ92852.1 Cell division protein, actin-like ATPase [Leptospira biflexa serovar Patoc strain 'Patoc 1 (Ames)']ABZ96459.1 Cell division protein FtsA (ATPase domain) [Leptospira biflexa serovar Patoc strain 'Patoc 1 (Paris)']TGM37782.1 cell division protein FtsA [Leptospira biflexa]TGM41116.1 cell division protein FtsA [Leptospira biflexa]TGM47319.1 cell division protein FtsA [Leptospira biflexa]